MTATLRSHAIASLLGVALVAVPGAAGAQGLRDLPPQPRQARRPRRRVAAPARVAQPSSRRGIPPGRRRQAPHRGLQGPAAVPVGADPPGRQDHDAPHRRPRRGRSHADRAPRPDRGRPEGVRHQPVVTVIVVEAVASNVYVMGEVNKPGPIPLQGPMTALQALAMAGRVQGLREHEGHPDPAAEPGGRRDDPVQLPRGRARATGPPSTCGRATPSSFPERARHDSDQAPRARARVRRRRGRPRPGAAPLGGGPGPDPGLDDDADLRRVERVGRQRDPLWRRRADGRGRDHDPDAHPRRAVPGLVTTGSRWATRGRSRRTAR